MKKQQMIKDILANYNEGSSIEELKCAREILEELSTEELKEVYSKRLEGNL